MRVCPLLRPAGRVRLFPDSIPTRVAGTRRAAPAALYCAHERFRDRRTHRTFDTGAPTAAGRIRLHLTLVPNRPRAGRTVAARISRRCRMGAVRTAPRDAAGGKDD